ncbi:AraC family transcriptional regulator [Aquibacillus koreensis]|uniref:AraC family transcriptional regulator n=1 Tax=Aquibacillus koreensis TaxID=279446 RepID=A0A9X4AKC1_9BACI|nr:AraC family transcriptional regulator [Aquibacillus koreensis]MCT2535493.1 AraC family transcriptional regulator [Aquibacillus koreensis]MDC3422694.1 AraC family transcriptional regulator [Aquibacillus koreensis]
MVFFEHHGVEETESFQFFQLVNYNFPLHFHRAYELIIVNEGQLELSIDQKDYVLEQNDLAFIFNNQMHEFRTTGHSNITIVIFTPELIGHFFMNYKGYIPENNVIHLQRASDLDALNSIYRQKSFLYDICSTLVENTSFVAVENSTKTKVLHKILLYVDGHYMHECTLKAVSKHLQYDYPYLSKLFVQMTHMTFTEYLNHYRISQACYLLKNSQQTIGEIAINCGYNNLRSFNRNFKKITNHSPKQYRELQ